jgi:hypothetical protein
MSRHLVCGVAIVTEIALALPPGPLFAQPKLPAAAEVGGRRPILTGQGVNSPEGTRDYVSNGRVVNGFALVPWPATYGASGIMSFIVNQDGIVFQTDLEPGPRRSLRR